MLQTSSASLGSVTLYRSSIQSVVFATRNLLSVVRMAFQGVFLMGAFYAAMNIKPRLQPKKEDIAPYKQIPGGAKIDVRYVRTQLYSCRAPSVWCRSECVLFYVGGCLTLIQEVMSLLCGT